MKTPKTPLFLSAFLVGSLSAFGAAADPAVAPAATAPAAAPAAATPPAAPAADAPAAGAAAQPPAGTAGRGGRRGGAGGAPAAANINHTEVPATGAIWMPSTPLRPGTFGDYPYGTDSIVHEGIPQGTWEKFTHTSAIVYPGIKRRVWIYVPAQYDPKVPACLMVVQDGVMQYAGREDDRTMGITAEYRVPSVIDNLAARGELPVIISVFIDSGSTNLGDTGRPTKENRGIEYDSVNDNYYQFISKEILPDVEKKYNIRKDPAGRAIIGISSGAICAFNVAFNHPDQFGKVLSDVGSFTSLRGGDVYPKLVRDADKKPIKVFMSDGVNDNRNPGMPQRDWYLQNKLMYEALRDKGYEVRYVLGENIHGSKLGGPIFPDSLRWLWADQLPKKDAKPADAAKPTAPAPAAATAAPKTAASN